MTTDQNEIKPEGQDSPWLGFAKFLLIAVLTVAIFLLVRSMVSHHFFSGGQLNRQ